MSDLLSGLGGLMKGFSGLMPQDDPAVILINAQTEVDDLKKQEDEIYKEIGKQAYSQNPSAWSQNEKLKLIQSNLAIATEKLQTVQNEQQAKEKAKEEEESSRRCPECGTINPEGVKFCQECGAKVGVAAKIYCTNCGQENPSGTRFCGGCGSKLGD